MGTTYNIKIVTDKNFDTKEIKNSIDLFELRGKLGGISKVDFDIVPGLGLGSL